MVSIYIILSGYLSVIGLKKIYANEKQTSTHIRWKYPKIVISCNIEGGWGVRGEGWVYKKDFKLLMTIVSLLLLRDSLCNYEIETNCTPISFMYWMHSRPLFIWWGYNCEGIRDRRDAMTWCRNSFCSSLGGWKNIYRYWTTLNGIFVTTRRYVIL